MNKKLTGAFGLRMWLYFTLMMVLAVAVFFIGEYSRVLAVVQFVAVIAFAQYARVSSRKRNAKLLDYLESVSEGMDLTVRDTPLPVVVFNSRTNAIIWSNDRFIAIADHRDQFVEKRITDVVPGFSGDWLLDGKNECPDITYLGDKCYRVFGSMVMSDREYIATTYWMDITEHIRISKEYIDSKLVFVILLIDNYDELIKGLSEKERSMLLSDIDENINIWAGDKGGYLCRYDRDRYFFLFEERYLSGYIEDKFSLLDTVRTNVGADGIHATLSIGMGKDGASPQENYRFANLGIEMALSRGGDQAVIKNTYGFEFFGGKSASHEKRTKVKSRIMANAFGELLADASTVYVMGHENADFDSVGAAVGVCCIARAKGKNARIVIDMNKNAAMKLVSFVGKTAEYKDIFISEQDAILEADSNSLLVVVDTTRTDKVESLSLLLSCSRIAVIDHHRRAAEYINNAVFNFHEPSASSASELVTEMMQYLLDQRDILREEAGALFVGIMLDTKGFSINTSSRTFDAASYLRRSGADATAAKHIMQTDIATATARYEIVSTAEMYAEGVAIASSDQSHSRTSIAQAADELLNINDIHTSFAIAREGDDVYVSGRSVADGENVQMILEKLGGGGSRSTAGLQVAGATVGKVTQDLKMAIDEYIASNVMDISRILNNPRM